MRSRGLQAAHELRDDNDRPLHIIHRDVSPHNVLIGCDGRSYITDFGIAKAEDRIQTTRTHEVKGKLAYLAPERVDKRRICTVQSDVFSMAVVLWECLAGRRLFRGDEAVDILQQVMSSPIATLHDIGANVPRALDDVIARALSRDLDTRYGTALGFAQAIERATAPEHQGTEADVARLMEAVFGARMGLRQSQVRETIGGNKLADLLRESGLPARDPAKTSEVATGKLVAELAPPVPTSRYAHSAELRARLRLRRVPWRHIAAVATPLCAAAIGAIVTLVVLTHRARPAPIVIRGTPATTADIAPSVPAVATRRLLLPLPFLASRVTLDDESRDLDPPSDVATFDVRTDGSTRHHVTVLAPDGTRAEGHAAEEDGVARPDGDGYSFSAPPQSDDPPRAMRRRATHPLRHRSERLHQAPLTSPERDCARGSARCLQERLPLLELPPAAEEDLGGHRPLRTKGTPREAHVRLVRGLPSFAKIADSAGRDEVFPRVVATARPRQHVVDVELPQRRSLAAILTLMGVSEHEVAARKAHRHPRRPVVPQEVHDPRHPEVSAHDGNGVVAVARRKIAPEREVVRVAFLVQRQAPRPRREGRSRASPSSPERERDSG